MNFVILEKNFMLSTSPFNVHVAVLELYKSN